jgi:hypothetical protein
MFYVIDNKEIKLALYDDDKDRILTTLELMPQYSSERLLETDIITASELLAHPNKVIIDDIEIEIDVPDEDEDGNTISTHKETITVKGLAINPNYETEEEQKHREYLNSLSLTKREVFLALYKDKGITPDQLKAGITDPEALIEFEYANDYFRGNPLITIIGQSLGYSSDDLDYLFEHKELPHEDTVVEVPDVSEDN